MKIQSLLSAALIGIVAVASTAKAIVLTYEYIPNVGAELAVLGPTGNFTAEASFDLSVFPQNGTLQIALPTTFFAEITGSTSPTALNRSWERDEIVPGSSWFYLFPGDVLLFAQLSAYDADVLPVGVSNDLLMGVGAFVSPTFIAGTWQLKSKSIPDGGPGLLAPMALAAMALAARRLRRKHSETV